MSARVSLRELLARPGGFVVAAELVTSRGPITSEGGARMLALARDLAADSRIDVLSITDNPGGHAMLSPDALGTDLISRGQEVIIHLACKDWNRNALESRGWQLSSAGFHNVLALSGDYPVMGHRGLAAPVFDIDSVGLMSLFSQMNAGLPDTRRTDSRLQRTDFFLGGVVTNGVQGGNEFTIDGAPNLSNARGVGFSPPSDAIAQFKVQTNAFDAQTGHTAGAVVNLALKSGTNAIHGQAGYFNRDDKRTSTPLLTERANGTKPTREYNRVTGTVGGPVIRGRTFFMVSAERLRDVQPEPSTFTVPTLKMRDGDQNAVLRSADPHARAEMRAHRLHATRDREEVVEEGAKPAVAAVLHERRAGHRWRQNIRAAAFRSRPRLGVPATKPRDRHIRCRRAARIRPECAGCRARHCAGAAPARAWCR